MWQSHVSTSPCFRLQFKSPLQLTTKQEVDTFIKGHHPADFSKFTPSSVLLLATDSTSGERIMVNSLATDRFCSSVPSGLTVFSLF